MEEINKSVNNQCFGTNTTMYINRRGRPAKHRTKTFCTPPTSFVVQLLRKCAANKSNILSSQTKCSLANGFQTPIEHLVESGGKWSSKSCDADEEQRCDQTLLDLDETRVTFNEINEYTTNDSDDNGQKAAGRKFKKLENKLHSCDHLNCTYMSKFSCNLIKHKRTHTNEKPFLCDQCCFRTNFVNSLKTHKRIHTLERPYCCEHCGHRSNSISNLKKHRLHVHTH